MSYPVYEDMKDSGAEWLDKVPQQWQQKRLKFCVKLINEKIDSIPETLPYLGLENIESKTGKVITGGEEDKAEGSCNLFAPGDVLFGKLRPYLAKATQPEMSGACTTELLVLRPVSLEGRYLLYYILSDNFINIVDSSTYGAKMPRASWDFIGDLLQLIPSFEEQQAIARFLDGKAAEIDEVIRLKEQHIELLNKKRQALINQVVTRGLDPSAKIRPSGIEWLGDMPEHWQTVKLKYLANIKYGLGQPPNQLDDGLPLLRATNIERGKINPAGLVFIDPNDVPYERDPVLKADDIIVVRSGAYTGDSAIIPAEFEGAIAGYDMVVRVTKANPHFIAYALLSVAILNNQIDVFRMRAAQPHLNAEELGECLFLVPPEDEQEEIVDYLNCETARVDEIAQTIQTQINKLRDYRQALISAAVTGKIDVRGLAV